MPHIAVMMYPGRTPERKEAVAKELRSQMARTLGMSEEHISVSIEEVAAENWEQTIRAKVAHEDIVIPSAFVR